MKNLNFLVLVFTALLIGFTGCKKNDPEDESGLQVDGKITTPTGKSCLLSKVLFPAYNDSYVYEYDAQNRPIKLNFYEGTVLEGYYTITYSSNQIVIKGYDDKGVLEGTSTYTVNNGVVASGTENDT